MIHENYIRINSRSNTHIGIPSAPFFLVLKIAFNKLNHKPTILILLHSLNSCSNLFNKPRDNVGKRWKEKKRMFAPS